MFVNDICVCALILMCKYGICSAFSGCNTYPILKYIYPACIYPEALCV
jgi:hypothetical protein